MNPLEQFTRKKFTEYLERHRIVFHPILERWYLFSKYGKEWWIEKDAIGKQEHTACEYHFEVQAQDALRTLFYQKMFRENSFSQDRIANFVDSKPEKHTFVFDLALEEQRHEGACQQEKDRYRTRLASFLRDYPDYCQRCYATGMLETEIYNEYDKCPMCLAQRQCPRCMRGETFEVIEATIEEHEYAVCRLCGWRCDYDFGDKFSLPEEPRCSCKSLREKRGEL